MGHLWTGLATLMRRTTEMSSAPQRHDLPEADQTSAPSNCSAKGFIEPGPDPEKFKLTDAEQAHLGNLLAWQEMSAKSTIVFGPSNDCQHCGAVNNPNNICCHQCGRRMDSPNSEIRDSR